MKRNTPLITLLVGAALGVVLLVASMLTTPSRALSKAAFWSGATSTRKREGVSLNRRAALVRSSYSPSNGTWVTS